MKSSINRRNYLSKLGVLLMTTTALIACRKFTEANLPIDQNTAKQVFEKTSTAVSAMTGIYDVMSNDELESGFVGRYGLSFLGGQLSDEIQVTPSYQFGDYIYKNNTDSPQTHLIFLVY